MSIAYPPRFLAFMPLLLDLETEHNRDGSVRTEHDPSDPGGTTKYGIDQRSHPRINIAALNEEGATAIYYLEWDAAPIDELPAGIGECLFDIYVNGGPGAIWLQEALSVRTDGFIGPQTLAAAAGLSAAQRQLVVNSMCNARGKRFTRLAATRSGFQKYLQGWFNRNQRVRMFCLNAAGTGDMSLSAAE